MNRIDLSICSESDGFVVVRSICWIGIVETERLTWRPAIIEHDISEILKIIDNRENVQVNTIV